MLKKHANEVKSCFADYLNRFVFHQIVKTKHTYYYFFSLSCIINLTFHAAYRWIRWVTQSKALLSKKVMKKVVAIAILLKYNPFYGTERYWRLTKWQVWKGWKVERKNFKRLAGRWRRDVFLHNGAPGHEVRQKLKHERVQGAAV